MVAVHLFNNNAQNQFHMREESLKHYLRTGTGWKLKYSGIMDEQYEFTDEHGDKQGVVVMRPSYAHMCVTAKIKEQEEVTKNERS